VSSDIVVQGVNIWKRYGGVEVLRGVDILVRRGEVVSIMGASGSGKTTLLLILGGLEEPDNGTVLIDGVDISGMSDDERALLRRKKIGFIFQYSYLMPEFTVLENVILPADDSRGRKEVIDKAMFLLDFLGIADKAGWSVWRLSGGEQQRASIARALINDPEIVFADEPTGNLDKENAIRVAELIIKSATNFNASAVIVTHNPEIAQLANTRYVLDNGKLHETSISA